MADDQAETATATATASRLQDRRILILYGTETGNSQDSAEELQRLAERLHFEADVFEMDDVRPVGFLFSLLLEQLLALPVAVLLCRLADT